MREPDLMVKMADLITDDLGMVLNFADGLVAERQQSATASRDGGVVNK